eukprot:CAMPEP_0206496496 /NCGR_PEP_ID=MMETSP0324_2-20121206/49453_1 /ASSEMBLY_ACC=CAM_ASM_000836 /TAXON_ID=2866 /ORGANISM="Crypthecodinium cohnii, Strain Seligo" /LENGTH=66 /DNA_ID=CAMNT_0053981543 /DNA_START=25 /DNA_END=222 /DNA_ORIENTATION=+
MTLRDANEEVNCVSVLFRRKNAPNQSTTTLLPCLEERMRSSRRRQLFRGWCWKNANDDIAQPWRAP